MLNIKKLRSRPRQFRLFVGLSVEEFDQLMAQVVLQYAAQEERRLTRSTRRRAVGGGHPFTLTLEARLLATLLYYRLHLTGLLLECLFGVDQSNLWRERNQRMMPVLLEVLPIPMQDHLLSALEEKSGKPSSSGSSSSSGSGSTGRSRKRIGTLKELLEAYPELRDLCVDGTEQEVPKPQNKRDKKHFYSGKSHCHTVKTQVTTAKRLVLHIMGGCPGSMADRQLLKASGVLRSISEAASPKKRKARQGKRAAKESKRRVRLDRGYSGLDKAGSPEKCEYGSLFGIKVLAALKGSGQKRLTALGKAWNYVLVSPQRMQVEQNIGHLKNWRVLSGLFRADRERHESTFAVVAGLHNFHILGSLSW